MSKHHDRQVARLEARQARHISEAPGMTKPGSMNRRKSYPIKVKR